MNLLNNVKFLSVEGPAAAGTTTLTTDIVDTQGFDGVTFVAYLGDVTDTSVLALTAESGDVADGSDAVALSASAGGTAGAADADDRLIVLDVIRPRNRYVRATLARGTANAVVNGIVAILHSAHQMPVVQDAAEVFASATANDPAAA